MHLQTLQTPDPNDKAQRFASHDRNRIRLHDAVSRANRHTAGGRYDERECGRTVQVWWYGLSCAHVANVCLRTGIIQCAPGMRRSHPELWAALVDEAGFDVAVEEVRHDG